MAETKLRKGGWQVNVEYFDDYVIKTPKTEEEIRATVSKYLASRNKLDELDKRVSDMQHDWKFSLSLILDSGIPLRMLAYPEFLSDGKIKQRRVLVLQNYFNKLHDEGKTEELHALIEKTFDFIIMLWKYGIHEKTFKISPEMGLMDEDIVLIDFGELTDDKEVVERQILKKAWEKSSTKYYPKGLADHFNKRASERLTIEVLYENWGIH